MYRFGRRALMTEQSNGRSHHPTMLRLGEAARILGVHPNTLRNWSNNGRIHTYRLGSRRDRRFVLDDLIQLVDSER